MAEKSASSPRYGGKTVEECEAMIRKSFQNPKVKFLRESMEKAGCAVGDNFFKPVSCDREMIGGFIPGKGVILCRNFVGFQDEVDQVIIHELIHAFDYCRAANMKWNDYAHRACTEIRANNLSGDCHWLRELLRGHLMRNNLKFRGHEQECIKRRVLQSLSANPNCTEAAVAKEAMEAVWDVCYNDTQPFDKPA